MVASKEDVLSFFMDTFGKETYPLCWQPEPSSFTDGEYESLSSKDQVLVDAFMFSPQLESVKLIEFGNDLKGLWQYMRKLLSFLCLVFIDRGSYRRLLL